jgi:5-(carboxyamino)imidazole ribonucleotide mutase
VATVAVGEPGAANAAILAAQILSIADTELAARLKAHRKAMADKILRG